MRPALSACLAALTATVLMVGGCKTSQPSLTRSNGTSPTISPSLIVPTREMAELGMLGKPGGWELARNDDSLGVGGSSGTYEYRTFEIRTRDHQWTSNGRARENSRTTIRTIRRGSVRSK